MIEKIEGKIIALEPISHIGETRSIDSKFNREKMMIKSKSGITKVIEVPIISGNALRGVLRRVAGFKLLYHLGIKKNELSEYMQHSMFSGGMLKKGADGGYYDTNFISDLRLNVPYLSLFGTVLGQQMIQSKMDVGQLVPVSCQTRGRTGIESDISIYSLLDEIAATRRDDIEDKVRGGAVNNEQKQQMRYTHEVLVAGTVFYHYFVLKHCNDYEQGAFWNTLIEYAKYSKIGGLACRGFGLISMDYEINENNVKLSSNYEKWITENQISITHYIRKMEGKF